MEQIQIPPVQTELLESYIDMFLDRHTVIELDELIERVVERKAYRETDEYAKESKAFLSKLLKDTPRPNNYKVVDAKSEDIVELENSCAMLKKLSSRSNLTHQERTALLFTYMRFGKLGEERLMQILKTQTNYREGITRVQVEQARKKDKIGISCKKLIEWCICNEKQCHNYKKIENTK